MPFNLYGGGAVTEAVTGGVGQVKSKAAERARKFFSTGTQAQYAAAGKSQISWDLLQRSLATFGTQALMEGDAFLDKAIEQLDTELKNIRTQTMQARAKADAESYAAHLRRKATMAQMRADAQAMKQARVGQVITGLGAAVSSLLGTFLGKIEVGKPQIEQYTSSVEQYMPQGGGERSFGPEY